MRLVRTRLVCAVIATSLCLIPVVAPVSDIAGKIPESDESDTNPANLRSGVNTRLDSDLIIGGNVGDEEQHPRTLAEQEPERATRQKSLYGDRRPYQNDGIEENATDTEKRISRQLFGAFLQRWTSPKPAPAQTQSVHTRPHPSGGGYSGPIGGSEEAPRIQRTWGSSWSGYGSTNYREQSPLVRDSDKKPEPKTVATRPKRDPDLTHSGSNRWGTWFAQIWTRPHQVKDTPKEPISTSAADGSDGKETSDITDIINSLTMTGDANDQPPGEEGDSPVEAPTFSPSANSAGDEPTVLPTEMPTEMEAYDDYNMDDTPAASPEASYTEDSGNFDSPVPPPNAWVEEAPVGMPSPTSSGDEPTVLPTELPTGMGEYDDYTRNDTPAASPAGSYTEDDGNFDSPVPPPNAWYEEAPVSSPSEASDSSPVVIDEEQPTVLPTELPTTYDAYDDSPTGSTTSPSPALSPVAESPNAVDYRTDTARPTGTAMPAAFDSPVAEMPSLSPSPVLSPVEESANAEPTYLPTDTSDEYESPVAEMPSLSPSPVLSPVEESLNAEPTYLPTEVGLRSDTFRPTGTAMPFSSYETTTEELPSMSPAPALSPTGDSFAEEPTYLPTGVGDGSDTLRPTGSGMPVSSFEEMPSLSPAPAEELPSMSPAPAAELLSMSPAPEPAYLPTGVSDSDTLRPTGTASPVSEFEEMPSLSPSPVLSPAAEVEKMPSMSPAPALSPVQESLQEEPTYLPTGVNAVSDTLRPTGTEVPVTEEMPSLSPSPVLSPMQDVAETEPTYLPTDVGERSDTVRPTGSNMPVSAYEGEPSLSPSPALSPVQETLGSEPTYLPTGVNDEYGTLGPTQTPAPTVDSPAASPVAAPAESLTLLPTATEVPAPQ